MKPKATDEQIVDALKRHRGIRAVAARELGIGTRAIQFRIDRMKADGVDIPESTYDGRPAGITGTSTLLGPDGQVKLQWVKQDAGHKTPEEWARHIKDVFADVEPVKRISAPAIGNKRLLTVLPIGDHHTAMYAYAAEAGADYDIKIASTVLASAAEHLVDIAPASERCLICNVGDFFHVDNLDAQTTRSHNSLDVDTRYAVMIKSGVTMLRAFIDRALEKFRIVEVENAIGNHDDIGALWLSLALSLLYEKNPRVKVNCSPSKFHYYRHGLVLLGVTHGDTAKLDKLPGIMAADQAEAWGATRHRYWLTGHIHQRKVLEFPGCMVESFRTLAARDAWATAAGYRSGRDMQAVVFHEEHGEVARHRFDIGMLEAA